MFLIHCDRAATKNAIRDELLFLASSAGEPLSKARADKLADKFKRGLFDPELERVLQYADPTAETACNNVMREAAA